MKFFLDGDLKVVLPGAAVALTAGLLLGGAMQPHLYDDDDRPVGPQIVTASGGARADGPADTGMMLAAYQGGAPDYVLGTDWKKTMAWPDERAAVSLPSRVAAEDDAPLADPPATFTRAAYDEPPAPHAYPSLNGGASSRVRPSVHAATDADVAADDDILPTSSQNGDQG